MANQAQLRKMRRMELIDLLLAITEENEKLKQEKALLEKQLENRRIVLAEAGSIAQAALQLSGIFEAAQAAADDYLRSVTGVDELPTDADEVSPAPTEDANVTDEESEKSETEN